MNYLIYLFLFIFALACGSFLNVIILRVYDKKSILGRSQCPYCQKELKVIDLIPLISYFLSAGKCRYCQKTISIQYPLVELGTGFCFLLIGLKFLLPITFASLLFTFYFLILTSLLIIIFVYDLKYSLIPNTIVYLAIFLAIGYWLIAYGFKISPLGFYWPPITNPLSLVTNLLTAIAIAVIPFFALYWLSHEKWLGFGDVKMAFLMGLLLGFPNILVALFLAFNLGAFVSILLVAFGKKTLKNEIPFGPFLVLATFITLLYGEAIIKWYVGLLV